MAISFVAEAHNNSISAGSTFTITKPTGVADGDTLLAFIGVYPGPGGAAVTFTAPSGWVKIGEQFSTSRPEFPMSIGVFKRESALAADPATWAGNYSRSISEPEVSVCVAYRGTAGVLTQGTTQAGTVSSLATSTVNNTLANSWRVTMGCYTSTTLAFNITSNDVSLRRREGVLDGGDSVQMAVYDSNASIATGNTNRTYSRSENWDSCCAAIVILKEASTTPTTGDMEGVELPKLTSSVSATATDSATVSATLPKLTSAISGEGQPQPSSGGFTGTLGKLATSFSGNTDVRGSFTATLPFTAEFLGETRFFGIRVILVDPDARVVTVPSRGVED
jgi:hypothetical protein